MRLERGRIGNDLPQALRHQQVGELGALAKNAELLRELPELSDVWKGLTYALDLAAKLRQPSGPQHRDNPERMVEHSGLTGNLAHRREAQTLTTEDLTERVAGADDHLDDLERGDAGRRQVHVGRAVYVVDPVGPLRRAAAGKSGSLRDRR